MKFWMIEILVRMVRLKKNMAHELGNLLLTQGLSWRALLGKNRAKRRLFSKVTPLHSASH